MLFLFYSFFCRCARRVGYVYVVSGTTWTTCLCSFVLVVLERSVVIDERLHVDVVTVYRNLNVRGEAEEFKCNKRRGEAEFFI